MKTDPMPMGGETPAFSSATHKGAGAKGEVGHESGRELGRYGSEPGPTLVCIAGLHGNEPSGLAAVERVLTILHRRKPRFRGRFIALAGNLPALRAKQRFLSSDLNRGWHPSRVSELKRRAVAGATLEDEDGQVVELTRALEEAFRGAAHGSDGLYVVDLHTTSSISAPFITLGDTLRNRSFARTLPVPFVLGIEEQIDAPMLEYLSERGGVTIGIEAGQHDRPASIDRHEWALWTVFRRLGCLGPSAIPEAADCRRRLRSATRDLAHAFEVRHRHEVLPGDGFAMLPGYRNFQRVKKGEVVANDASGQIRVPEDGYLFLPLYQAMGDDGLFIVQPVARAWLHLSWILRRLRVSAIVHWLPGVRRLSSHPDTVLVSRRIARWFAVELFHLLGFRRDRTSEDYYIFGRRAYDLEIPDELEPA